ncbi:MAG: DUF2252 family protein [Myxococcales bacterium]|nr:DUF2252 family protein [Myxococcales bacterium]
MARGDAWALAKQQFDDDRAVIERLDCIRAEDGRDARPWLLSKKRAKMCESAFGFFRGSLGFFERSLRQVRPIVADLSSEGWLVGDAHAENFGALRADREPPWKRGEAAFWINDFDAVREGPLVDDVLRLATSALLAGASRGEHPLQNLRWIEAVLEGYLTDEEVETPKPVRALLTKVEARKYDDFLRARTALRTDAKYEAHEFIRGERYLSLTKDEAKKTELLARDVATLYPAIAEREHGFYRVDDVAFRVAGNGSLGHFRAAVAVAPIDPEEPPWLFDMKESAVKPKALLAAREALAAIDAHPAMVKADGRTLMLRPLAPQEDKLSMAKIESSQFEPLFRYLGSVLGRAHGTSRAAWKRADRAAIEEATVALYGAHQSGHLAYTALTRTERG